MTKRFWKSPDGTTYPLIEAETSYAFKVYRSDCRKATPVDPHSCVIALGARHDPNIYDMFIGSGKDAYVIFRGRDGLVAVHYTMNARATKVRDDFDANKKLKTQWIKLSAPTAGRTLEHRSKLGKTRRAAIKAGATIKRRAKAPQTREQRIGVKHRPRARIVKGVVSLVVNNDKDAA